MTKVKLQTTIAITALIASIAAVPTYVFAGAKQQDPPPPRMNQGQRRPGQHPPAGLMRLFMDPAVKKELSLTDDQIAKLKATLQKQGPGQNTPPPPPGDDQAAPPAPGQGSRGDHAKAEHEAIKLVLSDTQWQRFSEIELQAMGARGLLRPDIAEKLSLTDDQKTELEKLAPQQGPMGGGMPPQGMGGGGMPPQGQGGPQGGPPPGGGPEDQGGPPPPPQGMGGGGLGMGPRGGGPGSPEQEAMTQKALKILTADQLATYKTLVGKTFKFSRPPRQGGPGGGMGGPGGGPGGGFGGGGQGGPGDGQAPPPDGGGAPDDVQASVIKVK